jgi:hypothetical protein
MKKMIQSATAWMLLCTLTAHLSNAVAQGTAFTYQGRLQNNGSPANGSYNLTFALFTDSNGVNQVGDTLTNTDTGITNGLFAVVLDFGPGNFTGNPLWLQIGVQTNGGAAFNTLAPLQQLMPVPYAIYSSSAGVATSATYAGLATSAVSANSVVAGSVTGTDIAGSSVVKSLNNLQDAVTLAPGANVTITPSGNTLTIASSGGGNNWSLTGNSGTIPGINFVGTTDTEPLEFDVNDLRALRLEPGVNGDGAPNFIGGSLVNFVTGGVTGATIGGGGAANYSGNSYPNSVTGDLGTVGGGEQNTAGNLATVGGGGQNMATNTYSTVSGGQYNLASGYGAFVGSGQYNIASGGQSVVGGGGFNFAYADYGVIGGGQNNVVSFDGALGCVVGGFGNQVNGNGGFVGGGGYDGTTSAANIADGNASTVGGGLGNVAGNIYATISGGVSNSASGPGSFVGGGGGNQALAGGSFVGGGGTDGTYVNGNTASGAGATVGGGLGNQATGAGSFIGGGGYDSLALPFGNIASGIASTIGGGLLNTANGLYSTVCGGGNNQAIAGLSFIGGGDDNSSTGYGSATGGGVANTNSGLYATIPGGYNNTAAGNYSFAAGEDSAANDNNSFLWCDGSRAGVSQGPNSFSVLATGGAWFFSGAYPAGVKLLAGGSQWISISDRNAKKNMKPVDCRAVLEKLAAIPIQQWNYKWEKDSDVPNIGPMAQDFKHAFYPGRDDKGIGTLEFDGVELAAIEGLNQKVDEKNSKIQEQAAEIADLQQSVADLKKLVQSLAEKK